MLLKSTPTVEILPTMIADISTPKNSTVRRTADRLEPTIFHERWWLDIATDGKCQFVEVVDNLRVIARLPYLAKRQHGFTLVHMPPLTHFLGPAIDDGGGKDNKRFLRRLDVARELIERLPPSSSCYIKCHRGATDILAFQNQGFRSAVQFTHEVHPQPVDAVWKGMRDKGRNGIRVARNFLNVDYDLTAMDFISFYNSNLESVGERNSLDMRVVGSLIEAALSKKRGALFGARDKAGHLTALIFCVWDGSSYYYLMATRTTTAHRGSISLLLWEAISDAMRRGLIFDFDGIINEGGARLAANFTPTVSPRYIATRESKAMRFWRAFQALRQEPNYFCQ